ncbi:hypothetical protein BOW37_08380 [Solemya velum gill symbiont]|nr:hypothetical protein BOW37_08380 [Solemya velum gill symbiont]OOZ47808.1 hypothetical protein BOW38_01245 [Solemya velum gill symbiont]OOZ50332.1 hypothetical protein BOW39_02815 [Solemya velum gill symbiont]OOZ52766.1 hypothetical protein BOW40_01250 [Solemya velum gill symbiont]OOZ55974.1 hypothetical protein BOW41_01255 [Solemya velum gill symbiont]
MGKGLMHRLLSRQLRKLDLTGSSLPDDVRWEALLQSISDTYQQADDDRYLLERSLQTSSDELQEMFQAQKATADGRLRALINTLPDLVFLLDEDGRYVDIISGDEHELVQPSMELKGKLLADVMSSEQASFFMDVIHRALETNTLQVVEYELAVQAGKRIFEGRVISTGLKVNDRKAVLFLARDVTELTKARNKLEHLATHDTLTGLPNRVLLENRLCQAVSRTKRTGKKAAVILMDLDRFKHVNDSLGHTVGDELLKEVSHRLKISCRAEDTVFRFGGDEFVIILEDLESAHHAGQAAKHFLDAFNDPLRLTEMELQISVSIGIAVVPDDGEEADILLRYADSTMYMAKEAGRNQYSFFTPELADNSANYLALEASLRKAISEHELVLRYQPQYSLEDDALIGLEALVRWPTAAPEFRNPNSFIPMAEITGLIEAMGIWVIEEACRQATTWLKRNLHFGRIAINLSSRQLNNASLVNEVKDILARYELPGSLLEFEITESMVLHEGGAIYSNLDTFSSMGIDLSIDDFGTGHSSLVNLKRLPLNRLKIDRSFVDGLGEDPNDEAITGASIALAKQLGYKVVAEGVETEKQAEFLRQHKCDFVQGYLYAKPMLSDEVEELLIQNHPAFGKISR